MKRELESEKARRVEVEHELVQVRNELEVVKQIPQKQLVVVKQLEVVDEVKQIPEKLMTRRARKLMRVGC